MKEMRREKRRTSTGSVTYSFATEDYERKSVGLLSNLSEGGACIYTQECLKEEKVKIYINGLLAEPINAEVIWCNQAIDNLYRVGVRFQS